MPLERRSKSSSEHCAPSPRYKISQGYFVVRLGHAEIENGCCQQSANTCIKLSKPRFTEATDTAYSRRKVCAKDVNGKGGFHGRVHDFVPNADLVTQITSAAELSAE